MSEDEIRGGTVYPPALLDQIEDVKNFEVEYPKGGRLLLISKHHLKPEVIEQCRGTFALAEKDGKPLIIDGSLSVYQWTGDQWQKLG